MQEHLAIASVPVQSWGECYEPEAALRVGTIFHDLDKPFFAALTDGQAHCCSSRTDGQACAGSAPEDGQICAGSVPENGKACTGGTPESGQTNDQTASPEQQERERMLLKIQESSFVLDDLRLYLDTHPEDGQGLAAFKERLAERKTLLRTFAQRFYPLTPDCMADIYESMPAMECYCWQKGPIPWEGACV